MVTVPLPSETLQHDHLMREDLQQSFTRSHIDPSSLSTFQRILLTTDGTVTHMLEAYLFEQIQVVKLSEQLISVSKDIPEMELIKGTNVIVRKIFLRGKISRRNFIYAESIVAPDRLDESFRKELLETKTPIGKIWLEQRVETFKEIVDSGKEPANDLADNFKIAPEENMLFRTYCVFTNRKPTMMITEKFPESYFRKGL
jgi:chorismate-pyruvate lyase